jgi:hypothetical protein
MSSWHTNMLLELLKPSREGQLYNISQRRYNSVKAILIGITYLSLFFCQLWLLQFLRGANRENKVDVAINNAGFDLMESLEEFLVNEIKAQIETTLFGTARLMQAVISMTRNREVGYCTNGQ